MGFWDDVDTTSGIDCPRPVSGLGLQGCLRRGVNLLHTCGSIGAGAAGRRFCQSRTVECRRSGGLRACGKSQGLGD